MRSGARAAGAAALVLALGVAAWARLSDFRDVLATGEAVPVKDGDSAYHLVRIRHAVERFPSLPTVDPTMNWPVGATCPWADGFDVLGAALALAAGGRGDLARTDVAAALFPVLLGLLVVWGAMDLARRVAGHGPGSARGVAVSLAAGVVTALLPQAVASSAYGAIDHHVAEALAMVLLGAWAVARPGPDVTRRARARWELAGAAAATFACWTFTGGPLYVALAVAVVLALGILDRRPGWLGSGAPALLLAAAATALLTAPALRQHGVPLSFQLPSLLQPLLLATAAVALAAPALAGRWLAGAPAGRRAALVVVAPVALALLVGAVLPAAARELLAGVSGWLLRHDRWLAMVDEFQPMWGRGRGLAVALAGFFGAPGVASPALVVAGGAWAIRRRGARGWAFAALSAALLALALVQLRFGRVFAPFLAVNLALAADAAASLALWRLRRPWLAAAVAGAVVLVASAADPWFRRALRVREPAALRSDAAAALALPPMRPDEPAPGVLCHWGSGHVVRLLSGRPVVLNGFGAYLDEATFWSLLQLARLDRATFDGLLRERRVGYVLAGAPTIGPEPMARTPQGWVLAPDAMRRLPMSPVIIAGSGIPDQGVKHLEHLLPVFASARVVEGLAFALPELWGYERVEGARVAGRAEPGARVVVELPFRERGRPHLYRAWADAGADGRFEVVVPLPTSFARPSLQVAPAARVRRGAAEPVSVEIPEAAVRGGARIELAGPPGRPRG